VCYISQVTIFLSSVAKTQHPPNMEVHLGKHSGWAQLCRGMDRGSDCAVDVALLETVSWLAEDRSPE
jgi:hypothetical protein